MSVEVPGLLRRCAAGQARALSVVANLALVSMIGVTAVDALLRVTTGSGVRGAIEYAQVLLVIVVYLGLAEAERAGSHVQVTLLLSRLGTAGRRAASIASLLVTVVVLGALIWATARQASVSLTRGERTAGVLGLPVWPVRSAIVVGIAAWLTCALRSPGTAATSAAAPNSSDGTAGLDSGTT